MKSYINQFICYTSNYVLPAITAGDLAGFFILFDVSFGKTTRIFPHIEGGKCLNSVE